MSWDGTSDPQRDRGLCGEGQQAASLDELQANVREVIEMLLEDGGPQYEGELVGTRLISVAA